MFLTIRARISKGGDVDKNLRRGRIPTNLNRKCSRDVSLKKIFAERVFQALGDYFNRYFNYQSDTNRVNVRKLRLSMVIEKANEPEDVLCSRAQKVLKTLDKSLVDKCWFRNNQGKLKQSTKS